jgi:hypothetical protein
VPDDVTEQRPGARRGKIFRFRGFTTAMKNDDIIITVNMKRAPPTTSKQT